MSCRNKEIVDKQKILEIALSVCEDKDNYFDRLEEGLYSLSLEEQNLVFGLTYIILLSRQFPMPKEIVKGFMKKINAKVQSMARDNEQYREYSKRQIDMILPTDKLRTDFSNQINTGQFSEALTTASKLLDMYEFGIADSHVNYQQLQRAREKYNVQMD